MAILVLVDGEITIRPRLRGTANQWRGTDNLARPDLKRRPRDTGSEIPHH